MPDFSRKQAFHLLISYDKVNNIVPVELATTRIRRMYDNSKGELDEQPMIARCSGSRVRCVFSTIDIRCASGAW